MAGLIRREDIDEVRSRIRIDEVVGEYVTLKPAGVGSMKGLCPFHDEKTPSFHVRTEVGRYHCFGCGEGGDVFTFLQELEQLSFVEAVENLAARAGIQLSYEEGSGPDREEAGKRQRLVDMHETAQAFFRAQLATPAATTAREFLTERGFDQEAAAQFGVGFAPQSWHALLDHLRHAGYRTDEIMASGLVSQGSRGPYDRFRGRLVWPIRDITARTIGFGARRLFADDQGPKYLNTPETVLYKKNQVLYGLDLAKREIAKTKRVVIVEGYTDVMAAHLAGVGQAVATCGTAFGGEHIKIIRRLLGDDSTHGSEVIFTFDGDEAGRKAALKAFDDDQRFVSQTYVAIEPNGMDPCDLRISKGDAAVRELIDTRRPLFEFALTSTVAGFDLSTVEGRVAGMRAAAPILADIRDHSLRPGYERLLAGLLGVDIAEVSAAVYQARKSQPRSKSAEAHRQPARTTANQQPAQQQAQGSAQRSAQGPTQSSDWHSARQPARHPASGPAPGPDHRPAPGPGHGSMPGPRNNQPRYNQPQHNQPQHPPQPAQQQSKTAYRVEHGALQVALQHPEFVNAALFDRLNGQVFGDLGHRAVHAAMQQAGGVQSALKDPAAWPGRVIEAAEPQVQGLVSELAVAPIPASDAAGVERYCTGIIARLFDKDMQRIAAELHSRLQRLGHSDPATAASLLEQLQVLESHRARLRELM